MSYFSMLLGLLQKPPSPVQDQTQPAPAAPAQPGQYQPSAALIACVGAACAMILVNTVPKYEGVRYVGYVDPVGIPTKCMGDTSNVVVGQTYSVADCMDSLSKQLIEHAQPVLACTPDLANRPEQLSAAVSLAYNIGAGAYCNSNIAKAFNAGNWLAACKLFPEYDMAGGKVLPGLVTRRNDEMQTCEVGL